MGDLVILLDKIERFVTEYRKCNGVLESPYTEILEAVIFVYKRFDSCPEIRVGDLTVGLSTRSRGEPADGSIYVSATIPGMAAVRCQVGFSRSRCFFYLADQL